MAALASFAAACTSNGTHGAEADATARPDERIGSMFVNPGGPGQSGVGLVRDSGEELDTFGGGRFDIVGWDPRGSNDSTHVECFTSSDEQDQFWKGVSIPSTPAESAVYPRKAEELASRCRTVQAKGTLPGLYRLFGVWMRVAASLTNQPPYC